MSNPLASLEIDTAEVSRRLASGEALILLDVREPEETKLAQIRNPRVQLAPLSKLAAVGIDALPTSAQDQDAAIIVYCHEGARSLQVAAWLVQQGWKHVVSMRGGIRAYALQVDPSTGLY